MACAGASSKPVAIRASREYAKRAAIDGPPIRPCFLPSLVMIIRWPREASRRYDARLERKLSHSYALRSLFRSHESSPILAQCMYVCVRKRIGNADEKLLERDHNKSLNGVTNEFCFY